jgi:phosphopantothenate synthetase
VATTREIYERCSTPAKQVTDVSIFDTAKQIATEQRHTLTDTGKTVITADHGEFLGDCERPISVRTYRHPEGVYVEGLVKVPWHIYEDGDRTGIVAERPSEGADEFEQVEQNLKDLGYRT